MTRRLLLLRWLLAACLAGAHARPVAAAEGQVAVIVAVGARGAPPTMEDLASIYRRQRQFAGGMRVQPVNLPASHPLRRWFSQQVLGQTPEEMESYWRDLYFNGVTPPFVLASEEAVIRFVAATPGAVGYVSGCSVDRRVKVLMQFEGGPACPR